MALISFLGKVLLSGIIISFVSWLSGRATALAGFLTALPLTTLIALAFSQMEWKDSTQSVEYAKSIFVAIPVTLLFFVPFLLAERLQLSFWQCYVLGIVLLGIGYLVFQYIVKAI